MQRIEVIRDRFDVIAQYCKGKDVLDLGCTDYRPDGKRKYASSGLHLSLKGISKSLTGVDIDAEGVDVLRHEGFQMVCADVETMSLGRQFDCVVAGELIEHLSNPGLFLENVRRHLKETGHLILTVPNAFGLVSLFRVLKEGEIKVHGEHTCWYDPKTISTLLQRHQFFVDKIYWFNKKKWYERRYFHKLKYQVPKLISRMRPYLSSNILVVARKRADVSDNSRAHSIKMIGDKEPLVSVVIPAHNHESFVEQAIESVMDQSYQNIELIVIDDGSSDRTAEIISSCAARYNGRIKYIKQENQGLVRTLNRGIQLASGKYWCQLASDDFMDKYNIERKVAYLEEHQQIDAVCSDAYWLNPDQTRSRMIPEKVKPNPLRTKSYSDYFGVKIMFPSLLFRRDVFERIGCFDESLRHFEDIEMKMRLLLRCQVGYLDEPLLTWRSHEMNTSKKSVVTRREKITAYERIFDHPELKSRWRLKRKILGDEYYKYARFLVRSGGKDRDHSALWYLGHSVSLYPFQLRCYSLLFRAILADASEGIKAGAK